MAIMAMIPLFSLLFISFSFGELLRIQLLNDIFVKPLDIAVVIFFIVWVIKVIAGKDFREIYRDKLFFAIVLFSLVGFISLLFNSKYLTLNEFLTSFAYLLRWGMYAGVYFAVKKFFYKKDILILKILFACGSLLLTLGFIQYFFYPNLRNLYYLGWDEHIYRMFSTFLDPNFAGAFFVLFLTFTSGLFFYSLYNKKIFLKNITFIVMCMALTSIFLTFSRSALVMLFVSVFVFLFLVKKPKWIFLLIVLFLVFFALSSRNFYIESVNLFRTASIEARIDSAKVAVHIIKSNPVFGVGFNAYRYAQIRYGFKEKENHIRNHAKAGTDNSFLFVMSTTGVVGLVVYLYLLYSIMRNAYLKYQKTKSSMLSYFLSIVVMTSFVGIIVDSLFINSLFYSFITLWLWVILGLMNRSR